jgi:hypothetical protein
MSKHTPGPWRVETAGLNIDRRPMIIAKGEHFIAEIDSDRAKADARLIAAAPELLKALKNQRCAGCAIPIGGPESGCLDCRQSRAAIQKAEGKS